MKTVKIMLTLAAFLGIPAFALSQQQPKMTIAAAADLKFAMDSIVTLYKVQNPETGIEVTYGSSGKFFEQISNETLYTCFFWQTLITPCN